MVSVQPKRFRLNRNVFGCESAESGSRAPPATAARPRPNQTIRALHTRGMGTQHLTRHRSFWSSPPLPGSPGAPPEQHGQHLRRGGGAACLVVSRQGTSVQDSETAPQCLEAGRNDLEGFQKLLETLQTYLILSGSFHEFHMNFVHAKTLCFSMHENHWKFMEASRSFPEASRRFLRASGSPQ